MTPLLPTRLVLAIAGACVLTAHASELEPVLTEMEGAVRTWQTSTTEGLPSDSVTAIIQTADGFLWVGTSTGLVRFDGIKFTDRLAETLGPGAIYVTALCEDKEGNLWIGTQRDGLFELKQGRVSQFTKASGLLDDSVTSLAADNQGFVWVGTKSGVNLVKGNQFKAFTVREGLPDNLVTSLHVARSGTVWITTRGGMCQFVDGQIAPYPLNTESRGRSPEYLGAYEDQAGNSWAYGDTYLINLGPEGKRFNYFRANEATSIRIWSLCGGKDGRLWIGTSGRGLFCFDHDRFHPVTLGDLSWPYGVRAIYEDRERNLWLGTSGNGLVQISPQQAHVIKAGQGLTASRPTGLALDASGRVLVGLQRGGVFIGEANRFERFGRPGGLEVQDFVSSLCVGRDGTVWAGTLGGGLYGFVNGRGIQITTADGLADDEVLAVCTDTQGAVWASTRAGTVHRFAGRGTSSYFDVTHDLSGAPVTALIPSSGGGVWLGTEDGSIIRGEPGRFATALPGEKLNRRPILALHEGQQGRLWIGTAGAGLACLGKGPAAIWNTGNGFPSDIVAGLVEDSAKNLCVATAAGIYRINESVIEKSLTDSQTAPACKLISDAKTSFDEGTIFGATRALLSPDGRLWFVTSDGLLNVDARQPQTEVTSLPVYLESVSLNARPAFSVLRAGPWSEAGPTNALRVRGELGSLDVWFTALSFTASEKIRFRHKLEGSDTEWVEDGTTRFAHYSRLPYGQYRFRVAARYADGAWQEAAAPFVFERPTPMYLREWAMVLYGLAGIALVAGVVRVVSHRRLRRALTRLEQQQSLERERMRIARDMHDEMGSKLTKISFLSEHAKVEAESSGALAGKIESIAETSRELLQAMDEIVWVVNPRNDTLEQLAAYLGHYAAEYFQTTSVECDVRLPSAIPHHPLSSEARHNLFLTFEEALNNALKHSAASKVKIEMLLNRADFEILITDNGRGFEVPPPFASNGSPRPTQDGHRGYGLKNMRQRLADIGGECLIRSPVTREGGTQVSMRIHLDGDTEVKT